MNDEAPSNVHRLRELSTQQPDEIAYVHVAIDGTETSVTWSELDRRSSQLAVALSARGVAYGDRVGLGIRNSPEFVYSVLATWKLGAVPIPVRWDVPDWELERLKEVIEPKVYIGPADLTWIQAPEDGPVPELPDLVSPHSNGICSSGATGTPKVILSQLPAVFNPMMGIPIAEAFMRVTRPQRILVL
ncbi:MAG TPA: AMP-binding protein, partial [Acidimicrobiia bacterium]|nr:AMP-binding protein [Acidimicrobiia bacterium]